MPPAAPRGFAATAFPGRSHPSSLGSLDETDRADCPLGDVRILRWRVVRVHRPYHRRDEYQSKRHPGLEGGALRGLRHMAVRMWKVAVGLLGIALLGGAALVATQPVARMMIMGPPHAAASFAQSSA